MTMSRSITEVAMGLLARREHSELELNRKLQQKGFNEEATEQVIEKLRSNNLLSNERFAETYINMRRQRGYGPLRIAQELKERGVDADVSTVYLDELADEWQGIMIQQYRKKYGNELIDEFKEKAKRMRFLQHRGYPLDMINQFINNQ
ncbi:MAG: recombination regulator RecX [Gammaproteobacteria bacterium]|nr:recombination regulator RecX [Gammaproteobacteria bacterium]MCW8909980.1 recombination regulator RecX [Gammaproteobacteria bacterium]MCW9005924.1 recombination regulator RecX [Gammaproteobacteria bacterium]MCW9056057.1 recombination regulator RecX [Gammaproteobacteria bacterium]